VSADDKKKTLETIQATNELLAKHLAAQQARDKAEAARRASLTPAQRAAEDSERAERLAQARRAEQLQKIAKLGDTVRKADTWTIAKFCWLLLAENPGEPEGFSFFDGRDSKVTKQHEQFREILESCVHTRLRPVNPKDAPAKYRFAVADLLDAAREKGLGCHEVLAEVVGIAGKPTEAPPRVALAAKGTASRERTRIARQKALLDMARGIAKAGEGKIYPTHIALSIGGKELNRRFQEKFPEWQVSEKTFEADRTAIKPRIEVALGRPRLPATKSPQKKTP
jgi:hypothetical protein